MGLLTRESRLRWRILEECTLSLLHLHFGLVCPACVDNKSANWYCMQSFNGQWRGLLLESDDKSQSRSRYLPDAGFNRPRGWGQILNYARVYGVGFYTNLCTRLHFNFSRNRCCETFLLLYCRPYSKKKKPASLWNVRRWEWKRVRVWWSSCNWSSRWSLFSSYGQSCLRYNRQR